MPRSSSADSGPGSIAVVVMPPSLLGAPSGGRRHRPQTVAANPQITRVQPSRPGRPSPLVVTAICVAGWPTASVVRRGEARRAADGPRAVRVYGRSMTASTSSRRDAVDALVGRLARLHASSVTMRTAAADMRDDGPPTSLMAVLSDIERDLALAAREAA